MPWLQPYRWKTITLDESVMLRALAILAIVFHNYLHWIAELPSENEFDYQPERIRALMWGLWNTPLDSVRLLATYFGHYGVQVFLFLSGYGITIKYRDRIPRWLAFEKARWSALYPSIAIAALGYILYESLREGWSLVIQQEGLNLIRQMIGLSNFLPDNIYHPIGPWWFIGVILQFYLLAPLILHWLRRHGDKILYMLGAGSFLLELLLGPILSKQFDLNINHSILGHLDVCALGIWFARRGDFPLPRIVIVGAGGLFILGNFHASLWITTGATFLLAALPLLRILSYRAQRQPWIQDDLMYIGQLSMYIFLCNGYLRNPLIDWARQQPHWWTSIWTSLVFLAIVVIWAMLLRKCEQVIRRTAAGG